MYHAAVYIWRERETAVVREATLGWGVYFPLVKQKKTSIASIY